MAAFISMVAESLYLSLMWLGVMRVNVIVQSSPLLYARLGRQIFQEALSAKVIEEKMELLIDECIV
jgi:uncharacterized protein YejL (UPF0352 family)